MYPTHGFTGLALLCVENSQYDEAAIRFSEAFQVQMKTGVTIGVYQSIVREKIKNLDSLQFVLKHFNK